MVFKLKVEAKTPARALLPCVNVTQVLHKLASRILFICVLKAGTPLLMRQSRFFHVMGGIDQDRPLTPKNAKPLKISLPMGTASAPRILNSWFYLFLRFSVHERLGGDLKPNFADARAPPPPISLCPCAGVITNSLVKIKQLTGQRGDEGGWGLRGFGTLSKFVLPSSS